MERVVRPRDEADWETDQAGLATRLVAAGIDLGLLFAVYSLASGVLASIISFTFGQQLSLAAAIVLGVLGFLAAGARLLRVLGARGPNAGDALPVDPAHLSRLTRHHARVGRATLSRRDPQRDPVRPGIPRRAA